MTKGPPIYLPSETENSEFHAGVGRAIAAYASVEETQVRLLSVALRTSREIVGVIFYAASNTRVRNEMIEDLLRLAVNDVAASYWSRCAQFLQKLASFRNAVAHWRPSHRVRIKFGSGSPSRATNILINPIPGKKTKALTVDQFPEFISDCKYIQAEILEFASFLYRASDADKWPEKYLRPAIRQNLADLQLPPKPKAPPRPPRPSRASRRKTALAKHKT